MSQQVVNANNNSSRLLTFLPWLLIPVVLIVLDHLFKFVIVHWIGPGSDRHRIDVLGRSVGLEYVENRGAAFGIFGTATETLALVSLGIAAFGIYMIWRDHADRPRAAFAIALIVGGAIGNVIDRIFRGYVIDFVAIGTFPRFNLADSAITIGVLLLLWAMVREEVQNDEPREGNKRPHG